MLGDRLAVNLILSSRVASPNAVVLSQDSGPSLVPVWGDRQAAVPQALRFPTCWNSTFNSL